MYILIKIMHTQSDLCDVTSITIYENYGYISF